MDKVRYSFTSNQGNFESVKIEFEKDFDPKIQSPDEAFAEVRKFVLDRVAQEAKPEPTVTRKNGAVTPQVNENAPVCERCGSPMRRKDLTSGSFWGCTKWKPDNKGCGFTINISG